ncbi:GNAT family N-acetyltransferase [Luteimonas kalidii]|uniref:GNAT family N-acetyltransferase n=1 Tax=Luteimonas kalidii TaxID=3042025 RepID=UPI003CE4F6D7
METASGPEASRHLEHIAALRMAVFREWPYLYQGDAAYERDYLAAYAASPRSVFVLALAGDEMVGAATGIPLADEAAAFRVPFEAQGTDPAQVFYFGESVLLPQWRGHGIGHAFFDGREAHARTLGGFAWTAFAAVERDPDDPRRPAHPRSHASFWRGRGYAPRPGLAMELEWTEPGRGPCMHALQVWMRALEPA